MPARALADQVEDDLLQQRFDTGRYDGNMRSVIEELQKRGTIRPAKREEIANYDVDWPWEETWTVQETGDLVRFRDTTPLTDRPK
jgi:hypothetical protein